MPQPKRTETLDRFRNGEIRLLVASDVAARGLDIQGLSHVFCFDVPIHAEDYVHRIGRTGRAGREGRSFMLAAPEDGNAVAAIVKLIGKDIPSIAIDGIEAAELDYQRAPISAARVAPPASAQRPAAAATDARQRGARQSAAPPEDRRAAPKSRGRAAAKAPRPDAPGSNVDDRSRVRPRRARPRQPERKPEPDRQVVGFGDHLPAFLARPPRIVARP